MKVIDLYKSLKNRTRTSLWIWDETGYIQLGYANSSYPFDNIPKAIQELPVKYIIPNNGSIHIMTDIQWEDYFESLDDALNSDYNSVYRDVAVKASYTFNSYNGECDFRGYVYAYIASTKNKHAYTLATCDLPFRDDTYSVACRIKDKKAIERAMEDAYDCWNSEDSDACILEGYDQDTIGQVCVGDFIEAWIRHLGYCINEDLELIRLEGYCFDEQEGEEDVSDYRDAHVTEHWFMRNKVLEYTRYQGLTLDEFMQTQTQDDVYNMQQEVGSILSKTRKK